VQSLPVANPLDAEALADAIEVEVGSEREPDRAVIKVLTAEHLLAIALKVGRPKGRELILRFAEARMLDWNRLRELLDRHGLTKMGEISSADGNRGAQMSSPKYPDISDIIARKEDGRRELAALSFSRKLAILEEMRERLAPLRKAFEKRRAKLATTSES